MNERNKRVIFRLLVIRNYLAEAIPIWIELLKLNLSVVYFQYRLFLKPIYWKLQFARFKAKRSIAKLQRKTGLSDEEIDLLIK